MVTYATGPLGNSPSGVVLGDVTGDGRLDIITSNYGTNTVGVLPGQASGFGAVQSFSMGANSRPNAVAVGDVNGNGRLDIATANYGTDAVGVLLNTGTYTPLATARLLSAELSLFPNPARGSFTVQLPAAWFAAAQVEVLNALGQVVRRFAAESPRFMVETAGLSPGVYTLRLGVSAGTVARRVVVE
ncbi:FG-GAP-like repeat-containing protein [Hymenobacter glaciei]|uniref:FG-GAP-like repeat-containing protein n=1 Tax=Hymenobacter glaciei TaxID=877209 RepID=UPI003CD0B62B